VDIMCGSPWRGWLSALDDPRLARVIERILEDPGARHSVESLARAASMSRSTFADRFAAAFERAPMSLVHHVRMQRAFELLTQDGSLSIEQVAGRVGYSSRSHFSRAFRRHHGLSPTACRTARHG
jgi:AraC-like DNA-binding protein